MRSPGMFKGYYKQDEATRDTITTDGWLRTGDAGFVDTRGHLVIIDRAKDVGKLASGQAFAPQFIENKLKFSPYIGEAVAFGHDRPFVAAMIAINGETVGNWAERRGIPYTSFRTSPPTRKCVQLIRDEIRKCNAGLPEAARIRRFLLLNKELDADDNEVTRTRKIRRRYVSEKYKAVDRRALRRPPRRRARRRHHFRGRPQVDRSAPTSRSTAPMKPRSRHGAGACLISTGSSRWS